MNKNIGLIALIIVALAIGGYFLLRDKNVASNGEDNQPVACTREARVCSDGSIVGREGPNCEFAACPDGLDSIDLSEFDEK